MKFDSASLVEQLCYSMRSADLPRSGNRASIARLFNGEAPYSPAEAQKGHIEVNVNFLEPTRIGHDARAQFAGAFMKTGNYFAATTDGGPPHKRAAWSAEVTRCVNRYLKQSLPYFECFRSKFASNVLFGIGPAAHRDADRWCPRMLGVEDVLIPGGTELVDIADDTIPFFALHQTWSAPQLIRMTKGEPRDPGWNMALVKEVLAWIDTESQTLMHSTFSDVWSPEKMAERQKGDGAAYAFDSAPRVDVYDFYFRDDAKEEGWRRRVILDAYTVDASGKSMSRRSTKPFGAGGDFLYNGKDRIFAKRMTEVVNFQFADLSAIAPHRYHSVRGLGFLIYAPCHLMNRLRCRFSESVFETLMMLFRVRGEEDVQRALNVTFANRGFVDSQVEFIPQAERWNPNHELVQLGLQENSRLISQHSNAWTQSPTEAPDRQEKTATQVMAEVNKSQQLVSAGLAQAYQYQVYEDREVFRRFLRKDSRDPDVRAFQAKVQRAGVPSKLLDPDAWDITHERILGEGSKTLAVAIANQMMQWRTLYDPEAQRVILHDATLALTGDPDRAEQLVPETPKVGDSVRWAQLAAAALLQGLPVNTPEGINRVEYIEALLASMATVVKRIAEQQEGVPTESELAGLQAMAMHIGENLAILAQNDAEKQRVRQYGDQLGQLMNLVKGFAQRLAEKQQSGNGDMDPKLAAELQAIAVKTEQDRKEREIAHAQRTAQRQAQWEMAQQQEAEKFAREQERKDVETAAEVRRKKEAADVELRAKQAQSAQAVASEKAKAAAAPKPAPAAAAKEPAAKPAPAKAVEVAPPKRGKRRLTVTSRDKNRDIATVLVEEVKE